MIFCFSADKNGAKQMTKLSECAQNDADKFLKFAGEFI